MGLFGTTWFKREIGENPVRSRHCNSSCNTFTTVASLWEGVLFKALVRRPANKNNADY